MTTTNIIGFILIAISIVVQVGSFVVRWFCIPSEPYFSEKTSCMVTYQASQIQDANTLLQTMFFLMMVQQLRKSCALVQQVRLQRVRVGKTAPAIIQIL